MALRAVPDHPKFAAFKTMLQLPKGAALGWLESVWHFTGRFTPQGNIGKYSDQQIEAWVEWDGLPGVLVVALLECGWLDKSTEYRLIVHDWHQYADVIVHTELARRCSLFANGTLPNSGRLNQAERERFKSAMGQPQVSHGSADTATKSATTPKPVPAPDPAPEPVPEPVISEAKASSPRTDSGKADPIEEIFKAYPRRVGKRAAIKAITKAIQRVKSNGMPTRDAEVYLYRRVQAYARSPAGHDSEFVPYPSKWFNEGRYDDESQEWEKKSSERGSNGNQGRNGFSGEQMSELLDSFGGSKTDHPF